MPSMAVPLPDDPETLKAMLVAERQRAERLEAIIKAMQRHRFGRRAETLPEDQLLLGLEDVEQAVASDATAAEAQSQAARGAASAKRRANRGALPSHLPRIETVCDLDDKSCPCCRGPLHQIGGHRPRPSSASWSRAGPRAAQSDPAMPAGPARTSSSRSRPRHGSSRAACRQRRRSPWSSWPNTPTTCRCTASRRSMRGKASDWTAPRSPIGRS